MHVHRVKVCGSRKVNHPGVAHALTEEVFKIDTLAGNGGGYSNFLAAYLGETQSYANSPEYLGNVANRGRDR